MPGPDPSPAASASEPPLHEAIRLEDTDGEFPRHWLSGSLKYTDFKALTEGGTATLQTCLDKNLHRTVVYKTLHPHLRDDESETRRFLREARVTSMIPHPGTVPVYELGRDRMGVMYFTMKQLKGNDLRSILMDLSAKNRKTEARFPLPVLVDVLIQACQTVAYAHAQGVIHRDLKPANILVGKFGEAMVLDWGLAKVKGEDEELDIPVKRGKEAVSMELTQPGKRFGTPLYMSPEQARGDADLDERSDVYNLGSILFEVLTLHSLVWGRDVDECMHQILERPTPVPSVFAPERSVPRELEAICLKALQRDPADRYDTVEAMMEDLLAYRAGDRVSVCTYGWINHWERWRDRHKLALAVIAAGATGLLLGWLFARGG